MSNLTKIEFELPVGYEDESGAIHKTVEMRKVKNSDIIAIQNDMSIKSIVKENLKMDTGNPVVAMRVNAQVIQMFNLLFTRVVLRLGSIDHPRRKVFDDMYQEDTAIMMEKYAELNGIDIDEAKASIMEGNVPLA